MQQTDILERITRPENAPVALLETEPVLNVVMVYQEELTRDWAVEALDQMTRTAGRENLRSTAWRMDDLAYPRILREAAWSAAQADIIVVSVSVADELPPELCKWIDNWLPLRAQRAGALMALIGLPEQSGSRTFRAQEYLRTVARSGQMDFFPNTRKLPAEASGFSQEQITHRANTTTQVLQDALDHERHFCYRRWGINE